jgi:hypothetical protein
VEGITETLALELKPLGIHVTAIEPGFFRTNFLDTTSLVRSETVIEDYSETVGKMRNIATQYNNNQPGDPAKLAQALIRVAYADHPPVHLPLGNEDIEELKEKRILFMAGGVGTAPVYPQVKWLSQRGVKVDVIIGTKTKATLLLEEELRKVAHNLYVATDDGSFGYKGLVTNLLKELVEKENKKYDLVIAIGPMIMMKFACVDGPEFDGHLVNFDEAMRRQTMYKNEEGREQLKAEEGDSHHRKGCDCEDNLPEKNNNLTESEAAIHG